MEVYKSGSLHNLQGVRVEEGIRPKSPGTYEGVKSALQITHHRTPLWNTMAFDSGPEGR